MVFHSVSKRVTVIFIIIDVAVRYKSDSVNLKAALRKASGFLSKFKVWREVFWYSLWKVYSYHES